MAWWSQARFRVLFHIFLGIFLGLLVALMFLSSSQIFKNYIRDAVQANFEQTYGHSIALNLDFIDVLSCRVVFSGIQITPKNHENSDLGWSVLIEKMEVSGSWLSMFLYRKCRVSLDLHKVFMFEQFEQVPEKIPFFCGQLLSGVADGFIEYDLISCHDSVLSFKKHDGLSMQIPYDCRLRAEKMGTRIQWYMHDGLVSDQEYEIISKITGSLVCEVPYQDGLSSLSGQIHIDYVLHKIDADVAGFLTGKFVQGLGDFNLKINDGSMIFESLQLRCMQNSCLCQATLQATAQLLHYFDIPELLHKLAGDLRLSVECDLFNILSTLKAAVKFNDIVYQSKTLLPAGTLTILDHDQKSFVGTLAFDEIAMFQVRVNLEDASKKCVIENVLDLNISGSNRYKVLKNNLEIAMACHDDGIDGSYHVVIHQDDIIFCTVNGTFVVRDGKIHIDGIGNDIAFKLLAQYFPELKFESLIAHKNNQSIIDLSANSINESAIQGLIDFSIIQALVPESLKFSFAQQGKCILSGSYKDGICSAHISMNDAHVRVPYIYNVIQNFSADCEYSVGDNSVTCKNMDIELYEGKISCSKADGYFDTTGFLSFVHMPLMFHDVMLSWNKGIYGIVSGSILVFKQNEQEPMQIQGQLMVQQAELKENIFSSEFQDLLAPALQQSTLSASFAQPNITLDVSLFTREPLQITTSFLTAQAVLDVHMNGPLFKPALSGSIRLLSGILNFPYKPVEIVQGRLTFMPEQPFDPLLEFLAKGKIKKYQVSLQAWGSALDPHVRFESEPYLNEEQIISLLLLGIQDQSLSLMVPAFLTQKLKDIIFGPALSKMKLKTVFDILLESLKYVRFIPQFSNQSGRGGVRGIFEIDATEHLQAKIDTNFAQLEDTKFDIDYAATDDLTIGLVKDGPSTYGGQMEFAWKFS